MKSNSTPSLVLLSSKRPNLELAPDEYIGQSAFLDPERHSGAAAIIENGEIIGIFTERDLLKRLIAPGLNLKTTQVRDVMTLKPETVSINADLSEALLIITKNNYRYLPVVDGKKFIGMIDIRDLYEALYILTKNALETQSNIFADMLREPYGTGGR